MQNFFLVYAVICGAAGMLLTAWPEVIETFSPGSQWVEHGLVRMIGAALVLAATGVASLRIVQEPAALWRATLWVVAGHFFLAFVLLAQVGIGDADKAGGNLALFLIVAGILIIGWRQALNDRGQRPGELIGLFGGAAPRKSIEDLRSSYEEQIRQAAGQEERNRMTRDLHDSIKQQIFAIHTAAAAAQVRFESDPAGAKAALEDVRASAREATAEMESMLDQLRAAPLEIVGLVEALRKHCEALEFRTGAKVLVKIGTLPANEDLPPGLPQAIFRIAQEALANVAKHARATVVNVSLDAVGTEMLLEIRDNGSGFDIMDAKAGMGLGNMRTRATEFGGIVEIDSRPGEGTATLIKIPFADPVPEIDPAVRWVQLCLIGLNLLTVSGVLGLHPRAPVVWILLAFLASMSILLLSQSYAKRKRLKAKVDRS